MKLAEIVKRVKPLAVVGSLDQEITGIAYDSRRVMPGHMFVAMRGERTDGHRFVEAAIDRGASAIVLERDAGFGRQRLRLRPAERPFRRLGHGVGDFQFAERESRSVRFGRTGHVRDIGFLVGECQHAGNGLCDGIGGPSARAQ